MIRRSGRLTDGLSSRPTGSRPYRPTTFTVGVPDWHVLSMRNEAVRFTLRRIYIQENDSGKAWTQWTTRGEFYSWQESNSGPYSHPESDLSSSLRKRVLRSTKLCSEYQTKPTVDVKTSGAIKGLKTRTFFDQLPQRTHFHNLHATDEINRPPVTSIRFVK